MNTFEKVVHKAIHKQALNSAVRDLSTAEVLDNLRADIELLKADGLLNMDAVLYIIDKHRNEVNDGHMD